MHSKPKLSSQEWYEIGVGTHIEADYINCGVSLIKITVRVSNPYEVALPHT